MIGGGHRLYPYIRPGYCHSHLSLIHDIMVQVLIMFFNLLLSLPMGLLSPPTPINTQICFGCYAVVTEVPTVS